MKLRPYAIGELHRRLRWVHGLKGLTVFEMFTPTPTCVYYLLWRGRPVYIGQTIDLNVRVAQHYANGDGKAFDGVVYESVPKSGLFHAECNRVRFFRPALNRRRNVTPADYWELYRGHRTFQHLVDAMESERLGIETDEWIATHRAAHEARELQELLGGG